MIAQFVILSFATLIAWQILKSVVWFEISVRLSTFVVLLLAYAGTYLMNSPSIVMALAATGGCALLFRYGIDPESIRPWKLPAPKPNVPTYRATTRKKSGLEKRVPSL